MTTATFTDRPAWKLALLALFAAVCAYLLHRNLGPYPKIFADEWYYSKMSRLQPLGEAIVPSYLYLWLFRASNACGSQFYECVHAGNLLFFAAAAPFVYLTARQVTSKRLAAFVALLSMLAPLNIYTAYFMPEATYYFGFCVLSWIALTRTHWHWARHAATLGLVLGVMSLVKVHALFLAPALCLFLLYARWAAGGRWLAGGLGAVAIALACTFAVKFGLGYLLAGDAALNLFGNFYQGAVKAAGARSVLNLVAPGLVNGKGHLMALALLLPLPLAMIAHSLLRPPTRAQVGKAGLLRLYALLMLGAAAGVTIIFTASIANPGLNDEGLRLHQRYYSFVFPLLWLVAAAAIGKPAQDQRPALRWAIALLMAALLAFTLFKLPTYALNPVDGPDLYAVNPHLPSGRILLALDLVALLLWARGHRHAAGFFLFAVLPASVAFGTVAADRVVVANKIEHPAEHASAYARLHIPPDERKLITVAGTDMQQMMRIQFHLDDKDTALLQLAPDAPIEPYQLPVRNKWLLVLGKHSLPAGVQPVVQNDEYTLVHVNTSHRRVALAMLTEPFGNGLIESAEGLSQSEPWGRWSDAKRVAIRFNRPLPKHLRLILTARAYGENAELPFVVRVGGKSARFKVGWVLEDIDLAFETDGSTRELVIEVPHPVSPTEHGELDPRTLGIGIGEIEVGEVTGRDLAAN
jgi:phosphoglycerol transferase